MAGERLYDIALKYKSTKLWKQLYDTDLFAVRLSDGDIGFCSVMGKLGEHVALALYIGKEGLESYWSVIDAANARSEAEYFEKLMLQDCVQCAFTNKDELTSPEIEEAQKYAKARGIAYRGRNAFPQFVRYRPYRYPWRLQDEVDEQHLFEALSAAIEVSEKLKEFDMSELGFTGGPPINGLVPMFERNGGGYVWSMTKLPGRRKKNYPSPVVRDDLLVARVNRAKKTKKAWICELFLLPMPLGDGAEGAAGESKIMSSEMQEAPFFPFMLLIIDCATNMVLFNELVADFKKDAEKLLVSLAQSMLKSGVPSEILVRDERTKALISAFAGQVGVRVTMCDELPVLDEVERELLAISRQDDSSKLAELFEALMEMDEEDMRSMPPEMLEQLLELAGQGVLPEEIEERVLRLKQ